MALDHYFLNLAYRLALENEGCTAPNPSVGAVITRGNTIAGYGYHERAGAPHAEVVALQRAADRARNATLYCSLEPCSHYGKTPPCVDQIIAAGTGRVVFGARDQNPLVSGNGEKILRERGIPVTQLSVSAIESFYAPFFHTFHSGRPYLIAKAGMTANGIISPADRNSRWITNETSLSWVHHLRARCDAILVGADTVVADRPRLTVRAKGLSRRPYRIVIDSHFKLIPKECSLLESDVPILICGAAGAPAGKEDVWSKYGVHTIRFESVSGLLSSLMELGLRKILIEGGQKIFTLFHTSGIIDEYVLMIAPRLLTGMQFLNFLAGPEQTLSDSPRYSPETILDLDGDIVVRMRRRDLFQ